MSENKAEIHVEESYIEELLKLSRNTHITMLINNMKLVEKISILRCSVFIW